MRARLRGEGPCLRPTPGPSSSRAETGGHILSDPWGAGTEQRGTLSRLGHFHWVPSNEARAGA